MMSKFDFSRVTAGYVPSDGSVHHDQLALAYIANHIFFPLKVPQRSDQSRVNDRAMCAIVCRFAEQYRELAEVDRTLWDPMIRMLENLRRIETCEALPAEDIQHQITCMHIGDSVVFYVRAQNAAVVVRKFAEEFVFESFEVAPSTADVMKATGKLLCSYPGPAIAVPNDIVEDAHFLKELSSFLAQMSVDELDSAATTRKAGSTVVEKRDSASPGYITQLLTGILRGVGRPADVDRVSKRINDDVLWKDAYLPRRRSPLWLVIRVALQTSLGRANALSEYKLFMVFFMSRLLRLTVQEEFASDHLYCFRAKLSRRLYKLGSSAPLFITQEVKDAVDETELLLQQRWQKIQEQQAVSPPWSPSMLDVQSDTCLTLHHSRDYISKRLTTKSTASAACSFEPNHTRRLRDTHCCDFSTFDEGALPTAFAADGDIYVALADFEMLVQNRVDNWVAECLGKEWACLKLAKCIQQYSQAARKAYVGNPEDHSMMLLTVLELWVALDKLAVAQCPLLREYSPEVPETLFHSLLLRKSASLERLSRSESHLKHRRKRAVPGWSVFSDTVDAHTFSVRYYLTALKMQALKQRIETDAERERGEKRAEVRRSNEDHRRLLQEATSLDHTHGRRDLGCAKCQLTQDARNMRVYVHEWPLPEGRYEAQATVFELQCPIPFCAWRETTYGVLHDICLYRRSRSASPEVVLKDYRALEKYQRDISSLTIASFTKSFVHSHYSSVPLPASESSVCVNNGLRYRLYDTRDHCWAADFTEEPSENLQHCTFSLPPTGFYRDMQYAIRDTTHGPNKVLANQSDCPVELDPHEYSAFGLLRSGALLQWLNILRGIRARELSFEREEVHLLLMQAIWQVGPSCDGVRTWHIEPSHPDFGLLLLTELRGLLSSIEGNWSNATSAKSVIMLSCRLLASTMDQDVRESAYGLLRDARRITFRWLHELSENLSKVVREDEIFSLQLRICAMAAICRSTYDVDLGDLGALLGSEEDVSVFIQCAVHLHDNIPTEKDVPSDLSLLLARDRRLSHFLEPALRDVIRRLSGVLDKPVAILWQEFQEGQTWVQMQEPNDRWMTVAYDRTTVHINALNGELLVNGKPLGRLPGAIVTHPDYTRIFSKKILDVIPSDMPGMDFATRADVFGFHVHFALDPQCGQLTIKARSGSTVYEVIPHSKFVGDLPTPLIIDYVHWLKIDTDPKRAEMELRPLGDLWTPSLDNWRIQFSMNGHSTMCRKDTWLVDNRSPSFAMISERLRPLECAEHLIITLSAGNCLLVDLPRFELSFVVEDGELMSRNWRGLIVDSNQSSKTMLGLSSQLVLTQRASTSSLPPERHVVIPIGDIKFYSSGHHVKVEVETGTTSRTRYHKYRIDSNLGYLVGNGTLLSKLYQVYLHALTSHCLPDPLTGRTGTEEALSELRSARCLSFQKLGPDEVTLLTQIGAMTPERQFYPAHLRVMQTVHWSDLSPISQHTDFWDCTVVILKHAQNLADMFYPEKDMASLLSDALKKQTSDRHLQNRAALRASIIYGREYSTWTATDGDDLPYTTRDLPQDTTSEKEVATVSALVHSWPTRLPTCSELLVVLRSWRAPLSAVDIELSYGKDWLLPDLPGIWIELYERCRLPSGADKRSQLLFALSAMSYKPEVPYIMEIIGTILAFAIDPRFTKLKPPLRLLEQYLLEDGFEPSEEKLRALAMSSTIPCHNWQSELTKGTIETEMEFADRHRSHYDEICEMEMHRLVAALKAQWPCHTPSRPMGSHQVIEMESFMEDAEVKFRSWYQNMELRKHLIQVQCILDQVRCQGAQEIAPYPVILRSPQSSTYQQTILANIADLLKREAPALGVHISGTLCHSLMIAKQAIRTDDLKVLIAKFKDQSNSTFKQHFGHRLERSRVDLETHPLSTMPNPSSYSATHFIRYQHLCHKVFKDMTAIIQQWLGPQSDVEYILYTSGQWPRLSTKNLLQHLASTSQTRRILSKEWEQCLISYAQACVQYQRSRRLLQYLEQKRYEDLAKELDNKEHWTVTDLDAGSVMDTDWLLVQIENDFLMRPLQQRVAREMIAPSSGRNMVLQLNMGEGKSAVIAPLVATALADGHKLTRVVVLKSLASQMFHLLVDRLSGLTNRRIFYLPFSRDVRMAPQVVERIRSLYEDCIRERGILVAQPEHILSFKLMGVDHSGDSVSQDGQVTKSLLESQRWLDTVARDILDESDEMLSVGYQLVYTAGQQRPVENHPDRWKTIQHVLSLIKDHSSHVHRRYPDEMEFVPGPSGTYPMIRILRDHAWEELAIGVAKHIVNTDPILRHLPENLRQAALTFITENASSVSGSGVRLLEQHYKGDGLWKKLLLLRGLLGYGLIGYVLKEKRWRVDYGLDLTRTLLAVPYRAKDVPSLRADFGHPDVAIVLTCLSYYYGGLTSEQLNTCFELLFRSDEREVLYESWVRGNDAVPPFLRQLIGVNYEDSYQWEHFLIPLFRQCHAVIDFYLAEVVFPRDAKEFPEKLSTSAWDLAETRTHVTTGFSGTNDNQDLLPSSITQHDPVDQLSTNARVLAYLLQPENKTYICVGGESTSSRDYLDLLVKQDPEVRVLLDVGAQMLDMENAELAKHWLSLTPHVAAAIFFDERDELMVLTQSGTMEPFVVSPYNQQLDRCSVYLDDAHTRGTDLKLPRETRAAVTLGPKVTKDRLLQGCMRMRKLGHGQSVLFLAPPEVDRSIRELAGTKETVETVDILRWAMVQACMYIEHHISHWAHQGMNFKKRSTAWEEFKTLSPGGLLQASDSGLTARSLRSTWLSPEARPLEEMYGPSAGNRGALSTDDSMFDDPEVRARFKLFGVTSLQDPSMDEEQEREVSQELEQEREVERPPRAQPAVHYVHPDVKRFVDTGCISLGSAFVGLFFPLEGTSEYPGNDVWSSRLLATRDFATTIDQRNSAHHPSNYMAPVNWIVSNASCSHLVVFSAFEVNALLPLIRRSKVVRLHVYSPRVTHSMKPFDDLNFYCITSLRKIWQPRLMDICQLNLCAGQLYFTNYEMYSQLCMYLGICAEERQEGARVRVDGFIEPQDRVEDMKSLCPFIKSPIPFMKELVGLRRKGMGYQLTHMGKVLHSGLLTEEDFQRPEVGIPCVATRNGVFISFLRRLPNAVRAHMHLFFLLLFCFFSIPTHILGSV
ncbi:hypothetical protein SCP_0705010 [Sparassis crispa]|uniref:ubiquitinyl hydrolase 1 n=1 Tax=Sparassis crispa TaxID=139825 RepID=A0A401GUA6_9APHY|nr:hypothetical protein SCP_0705010 [Sparassis crispa]GBE85314.1 hypothetical protein SCP_0705010 [Sparassis crispa]